MSARRWLVSALCVVVMPALARAQTLRGVVVDAANQPVAGVVVLLVDSIAQVSGRALSNARGEYRIAAPRAGSYRVRTLRIGFRPIISEPMVLRAGSEIDRRLSLTGLPLTLDTVRVADHNVCRAFTDSGAATFAVWDQVRTALTAAQLSTASRTISATTVTYDRALDPGPGRTTGHVLRQQAVVTTDYFVTREWRTLAPDSLRRVGYIVPEKDNSINYYAPGLEVLLSNVFVEDHCFRLTADRDHSGMLGIAFEPTPERRRIPEIRGTLWLDRATAEVRRLDFRYVNSTKDLQEQAGGDLEFVRMRDGTWAISRWNIRMPVYQQVIRPGLGAEMRLAELQVAGGELALARRGPDTLWAHPPLTLTGAVLDSASGNTIPGARLAFAGTTLETIADARGRFTMEGVLPGKYTIEVRTASLDSVIAVHRSALTVTDAATPIEIRAPNASKIATLICGAAVASRDRDNGIILGTVRFRGDSAPARPAGNLRVSAEWSTSPGGATSSVRRLEAPAAADGSFRLCGVPANASLSLRATADSARTPDPLTIQIPPNARLARTELTLERASVLAARGASFTGIVISDSSRAPIAGVEVALPDVGKSAFTDARGTFEISGIPVGEHRVVVRRIGYGAADTRLTFTADSAVERRVVLGRAVVLETMTVSARATDLQMASFEENRRVGLGHFMTRAELGKYDGMKLAGPLSQMVGLGLVNGKQGNAWVTSKHAPVYMCTTKECFIRHGFYVPEDHEKLRGMPVACYAQVYLDNILMTGNKSPTEPFDINSISPERIEAIEYYTGGAETPMKYNRAGSECGVLVLWTRR